MQYQSTRNKNLTASPKEAILQGLAPDGGLYINDPSKINFDWKSILNLSAKEMSSAILSAMFPDFNNMQDLVNKSYENKFESDELTPLVPVDDRYILELFRGPTSAFKDVALSVLPHLITNSMEKNNEKVVILTATSGDTGKAALEAFCDVEKTGICVFYPYKGTSKVQELQMTTQKGKNVKACAVYGNFDDVQSTVKQVFNSFQGQKPKGKMLSSANSINIGRLVPQIMYYFKAYSDLLKEKRIELGDFVHFVVPTGNFGDILAGYIAKLLGLPVAKLVCASNINNILSDFIKTGLYDKRREFYKTYSPSMDILISSNLERLLWLLCKDEEKIASYMKDLKEKGFYQIDSAMLSSLQENFACGFADDALCEKTIKAVYEKTGYLLDPHSAVAWAVSDEFKKNAENYPIVVLSTASPYKFPTVCLKALGEEVNENEFRQMEKLNKKTGVAIPKALLALENAKVRFSDVIKPEDMQDYVLNFLEEI